MAFKRMLKDPETRAKFQEHTQSTLEAQRDERTFKKNSPMRTLNANFTGHQTHHPQTDAALFASTNERGHLTISLDKDRQKDEKFNTMVRRAHRLRETGQEVKVKAKGVFKSERLRQEDGTQGQFWVFHATHMEMNGMDAQGKHTTTKVGFDKREIPAPFEEKKKSRQDER